MTYETHIHTYQYIIPGILEVDYGSSATKRAGGGGFL